MSDQEDSINPPSEPLEDLADAPDEDSSPGDSSSEQEGDVLNGGNVDPSGVSDEESGSPEPQPELTPSVQPADTTAPSSTSHSSTDGENDPPSDSVEEDPDPTSPIADSSETASTLAQETTPVVASPSDASASASFPDIAAELNAQFPPETEDSEMPPDVPFPFAYEIDDLRSLILELRQCEKKCEYQVEKTLETETGLHVKPVAIEPRTPVQQDEEGEGEEFIPPVMDFVGPLRSRGGLKVIADGLKTDSLGGLDGTEEDITLRRECYGTNEIPRRKPTHWSTYLLRAANDPVLILLAFVAFIALILGIVVPTVKQTTVPEGSSIPRGEIPWFLGWLHGTSMLVALIVVVAVTCLSDYHQDSSFRKLEQEIEKTKVVVFRSHAPISIPSEDLVPGDVAVLSSGHLVPADGIVLSSQGLTVDESSVTGESVWVRKDCRKPLLIGGTAIVSGSGRMLVLGTGENSEVGITMVQVTKEKVVDDVFVHQLQRVTLLVFAFAIVVAVLTLVALVIGMIAVKSIEGTWTMNFVADPICKNESMTLTVAQLESVANCGSFGDDLIQWTDFIIIAVTILVVAIPEGLPLSITIALADSVEKMFKDNALVRSLYACEAMGHCTTIATDKTGTLTENEMRVTDVWIAGIDAVRKDLMEPLPTIPSKGRISPMVYDLVREGVALNTVAELHRPTSCHDCRPHVLGSSTEGALLLLLDEIYEEDYLEIRRDFESFDEQLNCHQHSYLHRYTFNSTVMRQGSLIQRNEHELRFFCTGASEVVLTLCQFYLDNETGEILEMTDKARDDFESLIERMSGMSLRTVTLAFRDVDPDLHESPVDMTREELEEGLILFMVVGIEDPIRPHIVDSVRICKEAGIVVRMVTGDSLPTARVVAKRVGILSPEGTEGAEDEVCMIAHDFRRMDPTAKLEMLPNLRVMARADPDDKEEVVELLRDSMLECVAVTGDGTNDARALEAASIGFSMGKSGTAVAKAASDIVLLDDDFATIVDAVMWGRSIYCNLCKFVQFQLTVNIVTCVFVFVASLTRFVPFSDEEGGAVINYLPFSPIQLLWINLIMDTLAAIALSMEPPDREEILKKRPRRSYDAFVSGKMWISILVQSAYQLGVLLFLYYHGNVIEDLQALTYGDFRNAEWNAEYQRFVFDESTFLRPHVKNTVVFNAFVFMQIFNLFCCRKVRLEWNIFKDLGSSYLFLIVVISIVLIQIFIVNIGAWNVGNVLFNTTGLEWFHWAICVFCGAFTVVVHYVKTAITRYFYALLGPAVEAKRDAKHQEMERKFRHKRALELRRLQVDQMKMSFVRRMFSMKRIQMLSEISKTESENWGDVIIRRNRTTELDTVDLVSTPVENRDREVDPWESGELINVIIEGADDDFSEPEVEEEVAVPDEPAVEIVENEPEDEVVVEEEEAEEEEEEGEAVESENVDEEEAEAVGEDGAEEATSAEEDDEVSGEELEATGEEETVQDEPEAEAEDTSLRLPTGRRRRKSRSRGKKSRRKKKRKKSQMGRGGWLVDVHTLKDLPGDLVVEGRVAERYESGAGHTSVGSQVDSDSVFGDDDY